MDFSDLLTRENIDPGTVLVLRHRPSQPRLNKVISWIAGEKPDLFNSYQQTQSKSLEKAMAKLAGVGYVASFIGQHPGKALFVGLYAIDGARALTFAQYRRVPELAELEERGMEGWTGEDGRDEILWFDLTRKDFYSDWKGRLVVGWPPPERSWWRRAHRNKFPVLAVQEDGQLDTAMPEWTRIELSWAELGALPARWRATLSQWRAVYYIFDTSDGRGYVGSAYGSDNLLGRWLAYSARGHGGNKLLRGRDPANFRFSILQRVSPDMEAAEVIRLEASWKDRLHTRRPWGLNDN
jgi:hypothetical protein